MRRSRTKKFRIVLLLSIILIIISIIICNISVVYKVIYPLKYEDYVYRYAAENRVDPYLVFAIIKAESGFDTNATSKKGAKGLMQIMDATGNEAARKMGIIDFTTEDLYRPETNIRIGCWFIDKLISQFEDKDEVMDLDLVIASYNGGSRNVKEWLKNKKYSSSGEHLDVIPFKETEKFVKKVKNYISEYKKLYEK